MRYQFIVGSVFDQFIDVIKGFISLVTKPFTDVISAFTDKIEELFIGLGLADNMLDCVGAVIVNFIPVSAFKTCLTLTLPLMALNFTIAQIRAISSLGKINIFKNNWFDKLLGK